MALEIFLRMDGVTGSSRNYHHKGWADVTAWNWELQRTRNAADGSRAAVKANQISLTKAIGRDSPELMQIFIAGSTIPNAQLDVVSVAGRRDAQNKYVALTLEDVRIAALTTGGSAEQEFFSERLVLQFARFGFAFHQYGDASATGGAATPTGYGFGWDFRTGARVEAETRVTPEPAAPVG